MKLQEIVIIDSRPEPIETRRVYFTKKPGRKITKRKFGNYTLYRSKEKDFLYYGVFSNNDDLISYLELTKEPNYWQVSLPVTNRDYYRQGFARALYLYVLLQDKLVVASDWQQTPEVIGIWKQLSLDSRIEAVIYNIKTRETVPYNDGSDRPWENNNSNIIVIVKAK